MKQYVVTISRQFGSMGRSIAQALARQLDIDFYDRDIVEETARRMGLPVSTISDTEESANNIYYKRIYPLGMAIKSMQDEVFMVQQNIIRDLADRESCIIVGRCADEVLKDHPRLLNIHVFAPKADRLRNCVEKLGMDEATAKKTLPRVDKSRAGYHKVYGGGDEYVNCHLMLNSSQFGIEGSAHLLALIARDRFRL